MAVVYVDMNAEFVFETSLDAAAIPVVRGHLEDLLQAHEAVRNAELTHVRRGDGGRVHLRAWLLLEQSWANGPVADTMDSFHHLDNRRRDLVLRHGRVLLSRLHRARALM